MPPFNNYQYEALCAEDAIRVVVLDAATDEAVPLTCSLMQYPRSARAVEYYAVSYVWGKPEFTQSLEVRHDGDDTSYLRITPSVDVLLRHLRTLSDSCYLWIDAICLNQNDEAEKAQQIPMMGRIYEEAKGVHIWLGPSVPLTPKLFAFFRKSSRIPEAEQSKMAARLVFFLKKYFHEPLVGFSSVHDFFKTPWFSRRWVIQEACLARHATVHCGNYSIPLPVLASAARHVQNLDISDYLVKMAANLHRPAAGLTMLELLWNFHEADCLEPKDRIAALIGLLSEEHRFPMDYTAHWTKLYKQVASFMLCAGNNNVRLQMMLHLFEFGAVAVPEDGSYPSWVPDWTKTRQRKLPYHSHIRNVDTYEPYPRSPGQPELATLGFHHGALQICGDASTEAPHAGRVTLASSLPQPAEDGEQSAKEVMAVLCGLFARVPDAMTHILALCSLIKAIVGFRHTRKAQEDQALYTPSFDDFLDKIRRKLPKSRELKLLDALRNLPYLLHEFSLFVLSPRGAESEGGLGYGIGPKETQVGDMMIPLWYPDWDSDGPFVLPGERVTAVNAMTMLHVRLTGDTCFQHETISSGEETLPGVPKARVIGPALCVFPRSPPRGGNLDDDVKWAGNLGRYLLSWFTSADDDRRAGGAYPRSGKIDFCVS